MPPLLDRTLIDAAREAMRRAYPDHPWREPYREAVACAYQAGDLAAVAELSVLAAAHLSGEARIAEAIAEVEHGLALAAGHPASQAHLLRARSSLELFADDPTVALHTLEQAAAVDVPDPGARDRADRAIREVIARCVCLRAVRPEEFDAVRLLAEGTDFDWLATGLKQWVAPYLLASGHPREAGPWAESLTTHARARGSSWRMADAAAQVREVSAARGERPAPAGADLLPGGTNGPAIWATAALDLHQALIRADAAAADEALGRLTPGRILAPPALGQPRRAFEALVVALDGGRAPPLECPEQPSLLNLSSVLAAAEAVAVGGSQEDAVRWTRWLDGRLPDSIESCPDWPVSVHRIRALLAARAGDVRHGVARMRLAVAWADAARQPVEAAIARVQLAELIAVAPRAIARRQWLTIRDDGRSGCRALALPYPLHAHIAASAAALGRFDCERPQLAPREIEVLGLLAEGETYQRSAARLGLSWRTVQTIAHRAYQKLGVANKTQAISEARELGLL